MYTLEAILARKKTLTDAAEGFTNLKVIELPQNVSMIPVTGRLLYELEIRYQGGSNVEDPNTQQFSESLFHLRFERLIVGVDELAKHLSMKGTVAYVEATFTGGYSEHATMLYQNGERNNTPGTSIKEILILLGITPMHGFDEFDSIGLGRFRTTKEWFDYFTT